MKIILNAPENVTLTKKDGGILVEWKNAEEPSNYRNIEIRCNGTLVAEAKNDAMEALVSSFEGAPFETGKTYSLQVVAYDLIPLLRRLSDTQQDGESEPVEIVF